MQWEITGFLVQHLLAVVLRLNTEHTDEEEKPMLSPRLGNSYVKEIRDLTQ